MLWSSWVAAQLAASEEGLSSINEWVSEWWHWKSYIIVKFWCYHWEGCMWNMRCSVEFGYQLSVCPRTEGKPRETLIVLPAYLHDTVPCWRYLLGMTDSATQSFTLFIYFRLHRRYYTTVELELSNSRTVDSRTLEPSTLDSRTLVSVDWLFSSTLRLLG
jgi:hypothetical protein